MIDDEVTLDYAELIDDAMHYVVKKVLKKVQAEGLPGDHHFFITFKTGASGVMISDELRAKYPDEMTIVIQHQFYDLEINDDNFSIVLSFDHIKQNLTIPFSSLISFVDPSVKFGLQFNSSAYDDEFEQEDEQGDYNMEQDELPKNSNNVIALDAFRKGKGGKKDG